jgi:hypothetical protein
LENQSYSNNPSADQGRANPVLPRSIQDRLEQVGLLVVSSPDAEPVKSSQAIDLKKQQVRNVVSFTIPSLLGQTRKASLTGTPHDIIIAILLVHFKKLGPSLTPFSCSVLFRAVLVDFKPNTVDQRKVDVKFRECKVVVNRSPININIPLGILGPTGWLRTGYIDESMRITRGHKGSVFILTRPGRSTLD